MDSRGHLPAQFGDRELDAIVPTIGEARGNEFGPPIRVTDRADALVISGQPEIMAVRHGRPRGRQQYSRQMYPLTRYQRVGATAHRDAHQGGRPFRRQTPQHNGAQHQPHSFAMGLNGLDTSVDPHRPHFARQHRGPNRLGAYLGHGKAQRGRSQKRHGDTQWRFMRVGRYGTSHECDASGHHSERPYRLDRKRKVDADARPKRHRQPQGPARLIGQSLFAQTGNRPRSSLFQRGSIEPAELRR